MVMDVTMRLLVDNVAGDGLMVEHGFSAWLEVGEDRLLLDTGAGAALAANASRLGVDLASASAIILSHGHYDHTSGLSHVLSVNDSAGVCFAPGVDRDRFSRHSDKEPRSVGMSPEVRERLHALPGERLHETSRPRMLAPGIGVTGPIPRMCPFEDTGGPFFLDAEGQKADLISDEQALWFDTVGGLVVVGGCCHAGIINTVNWIRAATGVSRVRGIVGGLHLLNASDARLEKTLAHVRDWNLDFIAPCHCTGARVVDLMCAELGEVVRPMRSGVSLALGELRA
jgi:7,8-dihydropterin-6-yl-methyl-4-(beta-D-ribofuranosyl)aminobenzene 5'-phosphate synthase